MGFVPLSREFLNSHVHHVGGLKGARMMELGNQQMYCHADIKEGSSAKPWFESQGVHHTSIDLNGKDGAIVLDLSTRIDNILWTGLFDIVTDFGTSEHVGEGIHKLYNCRANCYNWCRVGGLMLFMNPKTGHWPLHGYHYFTKEHYEKLALATQATILEISEHPSLGNYIDGWQVHAALVKTRFEFVTIQEFMDLCDGTVFSK